LGVARDASAEEVRAAYRHLTQQYHPDKVAHLAPEFQELAERRMRGINSAYEQMQNR
jgi:DnaJ-class molecular chaperone